jgi:hypothetical protein
MEMRCKKNKEAFCVGNDAASSILKPITDKTDCCYAVMVKNNNGKEGFAGFSSSFEGVQVIAKRFMEICKKFYPNEGVYYTGFKRWSSKQLSDCLLKFKSNGVRCLFLMYGFDQDIPLFMIRCPEDIHEDTYEEYIKNSKKKEN